MTQNINQRTRIRTTLAAVLLAAVATILVTTFGARSAEAAFPGENGKIVFEGLDLNTWNYEIYTVGADGSNPTPLTDDPAEDRMPALSPDGKKIAFASNRGGTYAIYVMGSDGSNPTRLTNEPGMEDSQPSWSPDGKKLVFQRTITIENNPEIYVVDADGSNPTRLTENASFDSAPAFSPDGSKIAFMSLRDGDSEIFVMKSDGSDQTNLTNNSVYDAAPNWSADGSKLTFVSERDGVDTEVFIMGPDGSGQTNLTDNDSSDYDPAFSPAGDKIAFSSDRDGDAEIYTMDAADGSNASRLTDSPTINADPDWQPLHDTTPPTVRLTAPSNGAAVSGSSVTLSAGSSDDKGVARVDFYVGSEKVGTDSTAGGTSGTEYRTSWNSTTSPGGSAIIEARAYDTAGNEKVSASRTITVDNAAPTVRRVAPQENATGIAPGANVSARFSEAMKPSSINRGTFKLYKRGSTTAITARVTYDVATKRAVLDPSAKLARGATYKAVLTAGARDLAGNQLSQQKVWFFTIISLR